VKLKRERRCSECWHLFASPESIRIHRLIGGRCRTEDELKAAGYSWTPRGWLQGAGKPKLDEVVAK